MANVITVVDNPVGGYYERLLISVALSGNYVQAVNAAAGELIDLGLLLNTPQVDGARSHLEPPLGWKVVQCPGGYVASLIYLTATTFLLKIYTTAAVELAAAAYPAGLLAATPPDCPLLIEFDYGTLA